MKTLELRENDTLFLPEAALTDDEAVELKETGFFELDFPSPLNARHFVIRSPRTVGLIPITRDLMVRVVPKVPTANLFGMLERIYRLPSLKFYDGTGEVEAVDDMYRRLADMLARGVLHRSRRGLYSDYVEVDERLLTVRGRIDLAGSMRARMSGRAEMQCSYSVRTIDVAENRLVLAALDRIPRLGLTAGPALDAVRLARRALVGSVRLDEYAGRDCVGRSYNRLNSDYQQLHALSRFFLESMGPRLDPGRHDFLPFTLDMAFLFQEFVAESLQDSLEGKLAVTPQHRVDLGGELGITLVMDIVLSEVNSGRAVAVIDAKYKADSEPSPQDVYQAVAYATQLGINHAVLVYPVATTGPRSDRIGSVQITAIGYDIGSAMAASRTKFIADLSTAIARQL